MSAAGEARESQLPRITPLDKDRKLTDVSQPGAYQKRTAGGRETAVQTRQGGVKGRQGLPQSVGHTHMGSLELLQLCGSQCQENDRQCLQSVSNQWYNLGCSTIPVLMKCL